MGQVRRAEVICMRDRFGSKTQPLIGQFADVFVARLANFGDGPTGVGLPNAATPTLFRHLGKQRRPFRPVRATIPSNNLDLLSG
jgi:hypothetical protein